MLGMGGSAIGGDLVRGHLVRPAHACRWRSCAATTCRPGSARTRSSSPAPTAARPRRPSARSGDRARAALPGRGHHHAAARCGTWPSVPSLPLARRSRRGGQPRASWATRWASWPGSSSAPACWPSTRPRSRPAAAAAARRWPPAARRTCPPRTTPPSSSPGRCVDRLPVIAARRLPGARGAALEDAAQRERQGRGRLRGAAGGDPQHGRRLRAAGVAARPPLRRLPGQRRSTTRATPLRAQLIGELLDDRRASPTQSVRVDRGRAARAGAARRSCWATT